MTVKSIRKYLLPTMLVSAMLFTAGCGRHRDIRLGFRSRVQREILGGEGRGGLESPIFSRIRWAYPRGYHISRIWERYVFVRV